MPSESGSVPGSNSWNQRLFTVLWVWLAVRTILPWLVSFRLTFEGAGYSWGTSYFGHSFHSAGLARPDVLLVYALLAASLIIIFQLRRFNFRWGAPMLVGFLGIFAADALYQLIAGDQMIFHGDTLGVKLNLTIPFFVFQFTMFAIALIWWKGLKSIGETAPPRSMSNARKAIIKICIFFVPVQLVLLIFGEPHGLTDAIGVIGTITQWVLLAWALYPGSKYRIHPA
jgi:hypothetical protein